MIRLMKNTSRIGKKYKVVMGHYKTSDLSGRRVWKTDLWISEHDSLSEASAAYFRSVNKAKEG